MEVQPLTLLQLKGHAHSSELDTAAPTRRLLLDREAEEEESEDEDREAN